LLLTGIVMSNEGNTVTTVPRILIANDQEWTARSLGSILAAEGYEVIRAFTGRQAFERALDSRPDLIVLDTQLPDINGPEVCRRLRAQPSIGWVVPIILTTAGSNGRSRMMEAMEAGAWDFATQPFDGPMLLARIRTYINAKASYDAVMAKATVDPITGTYNRRGLELKLTELWAEARRRHETVTCLVISPRNPKLAAALEAGDELARMLANALRASVRASDAVARISALDFAVMAPNLDREVALRVLDRLHDQLAALGGKTDIPLRTGIATVDTADGMDADGLLQRATAAVDWTSADRPVAVNE
jgi:two-component system cell cycle response regulator